MKIGINGIESPCHNCADRSQSCHSSCAKYAGYQDKIKRRNDARSKHYGSNELIFESIQRHKGRK